MVFPTISDKSISLEEVNKIETSPVHGLVATAQGLHIARVEASHRLLLSGDGEATNGWAKCRKPNKEPSQKIL